MKEPESNPGLSTAMASERLKKDGYNELPRSDKRGFWRPAQLLFHFGRLHWDDLAVSAVAGFFSLLLLVTIKSIWFSVGGKDKKARLPRRI